MLRSGNQDSKLPKQNDTQADPEAVDLPCWLAIIGGIVVASHPEGGPYPILHPCKGLRLFINGQEKTEPVPVRTSDHVEIRGTTEIEKGSWHLQVSPDKMEAVLHIKPDLVIKRIVKDMPPSRYLRPEFQEVKESSAPLTLKELAEELAQKGIKYGIDRTAFNLALTVTEETSIVVARGKEPVPGTDADVEFFFENRAKVPIEKDLNSTVDFRDIFSYISVEAGTVLARKRPAVKGTPGIAVSGELIPPPEPRDIELFAGQGCVISDDGLEAIAINFGRPVAKRKENGVLISVLPILQHQGDVDISSGNISFNGDISISGQIKEKMCVKAGGNVAVKGIVSHSEVMAGGSIIVHNNIFSSTLIAGLYQVFPQQLVQVLKKIDKGLQNVVSIMKMLADKQSQEKLPVGSEILKNYQDLTSAITLLSEGVQQFPQLTAIEEFRLLVNSLTAIARSPLTATSPVFLEKTANALSNFLKDVNPPSQEEGNIIIHYAVSSTLMAANRIQVTGKGCYHCELHAGNSVRVDGIFRGGKILAGGDVYIGTLGARGTPTSVATTEGSITAGYVFEGSLIRIGKSSYKFERDEEKVVLTLDPTENRINKTYW